MSSASQDYSSKFERIVGQTDFRYLPQSEQEFVRDRAGELKLTQQELRQLSDIALERIRWKEPPLSSVWRKGGAAGRQDKKQALQALARQHDELRGRLHDYRDLDAGDRPRTTRPVLRSGAREKLGLGRCPVASPQTRCCNLMTLDAVEKCGFDCSYCSIQSFYHGDEVVFDSGFAEKLATLELDPERRYHIGTGQSSDSLMWGNHEGVLEALCSFAAAHPNVILELKTKSRNVGWLLQNDVPANVICTWSLNTPTIIENEEHLSASLDRRIEAARQVAARGNLVGFHFHPMVWYDGWKEEYSDICRRITGEFESSQVAMVSMGTLTWTRSVMKTIRRRDFVSRILQMPLEESAGKWSYPESIKLELFAHLYGELQAWKDRVFFYLCMEPASLWQPVLGYDYADNDEFEEAMKSAYFEKIRQSGALQPEMKGL